MPDMELLFVVALTEAVPGRGLKRGQVGTVVECLGSGAYEIEFIDDQGRTYALEALREHQLMRLHYEPADRAA